MLGIMWWVAAVYSSDKVHISRLAPAASLWIAKVLWKLAETMIRGKDAALGQGVSQEPLPTVVLVLEQFVPVLCHCRC